MKKTFTLNHPKKKPARVLDSIKSEINKYVKRERRKPLPEGVDFWDFDCRIGATAETATEVHLQELSQGLDALQMRDLESFYVEIIAKPAKRTKKPGK